MSGLSNDIYVRDRMERDRTDYDGSGFGSEFYDERRERFEKRKEAHLPFLFLACIILCLGMNIYLSISELNYYINGETAVGTYSDNKEHAVWMTPEGNKKVVSTSWSAQKGDTVTVYYFGNDYGNAKVMSAFTVWAGFYGFFGLLLALDIFWLYRVFHKSRHAERKG